MVSKGSEKLFRPESAQAMKSTVAKSQVPPWVDCRKMHRSAYGRQAKGQGIKQERG